MLALYGILIGIDFVITYAFYERFQMAGEKMNEIYVIIGFEVSDTNTCKGYIVREAVSKGDTGQFQVYHQSGGVVL